MYRRPFVRRFYRPVVVARPLLWRRRWFGWGWGFGGCALMLMMLGCMSLAMMVLVRRF